ncbi:MFS transporter [Ruania zhangjianzhongii]|uniref:MFS transporter n=1 Tax=Ruania zhangjianzhongii TaxID=2603206 RepID=UPI0011C7956E|nr:MFS transporter [Ruania zhangjianzhongii]
MAGESVPQSRPLKYGEPAGRWVLASTVLGSSVAFLDATVVNIALPAIDQQLSAGVAGLTWTVNAYNLTLAAFVLIGGSLGDRYGRRRVFMVGVAWFGLTSLACALATNIGMLVTFRALQGIGAALLTPVALAILQAAFRAEDRARAIGAWSGLAGITGAVGPLLGGWLIELASWRWIFLINVPVVLVVLVIAHRHVPESRHVAARGRLDLGGASLAALTLGLLTYALTVSSEQDGHWLTVAAGGGLGVLALAGFLYRERTAADPLLPLDIFRAPRFGATNAATFLVYAALGTVFFWLVLALQVVSGWTPLAAGLALLPVTVLMLFFSPAAGLASNRWGPRIPMTLGPLVAAAGVALLSRVGPHPAIVTDVLLPVTLLGAGLTLTVTPLTATVLGAVDEARAGLASGVNNAVARTGGLVLVAAMPALTGLGGEGFSDAEALGPAFTTAMAICAGVLVVAGVGAGLMIRGPAELPSPGPTCPRRHCAVDATPLGVSEARKTELP